MTIKVVRLGTPRAPDEGPRLGTVRRPPRGVPKNEFARRDFYDAWLPNLAPSAELVKFAQGARSERDWSVFKRRYRTEMAAPDNAHVLDALAALSRHANFAVGCYCEDETRCHRSALRELLREHGASVE